LAKSEEGPLGVKASSKKLGVEYVQKSKRKRIKDTRQKEWESKRGKPKKRLGTRKTNSSGSKYGCGGQRGKICRTKGK